LEKYYNYIYINTFYFFKKIIKIIIIIGKVVYIENPSYKNKEVTGKMLMEVEQRGDDRKMLLFLCPVSLLLLYYYCYYYNFLLLIVILK